MTSLLTALLGALVATCVALSAGIAWIIRTSKDAGRREGKLDDALVKLTKVETQLELVTKHEVKISMLEPLVSRMASDIRDLLRRARGGSQPNFHHGDEEE